ncbi:PucR family transcriptional regulator [Amycolatopsis balhimycina DSM 5908]|uniref:PucR family transcriptional regulator n=1 Tax=Amycolatopsis balhimycina DSM 5908 TaxID=1081091 RepID=A0A428VZ89_AMYBA|nr:PucR family transcriptional regulator [Amycolatopsis balhimycina]RSM36140.1 PucR family transcriptional regulator [Amycolatopsis balhimycina DSM 5908]
MALTLRALADDRPLGLRVLTGEDVLDRPIGWVHPTELTDPRAFLEGGELLLTTGLALDEATSPAYVRRLVDAGAAGLGFGVGLSHDDVPRALVATAAEVGLPVLEVPRKTPFIAITRAISRAVAADEYATTVRIGRAQQDLTRTAVGKSGPAGVVRKLANLVDGWVLLFERTTVTEAAPASARAYGASLREELERLRTGTRVFSLDGQEVVLQTLDTGARRVLAVGTEAPLDTAGRHIVNTAVSVLSLALEQDRAQAAARQALRTGLLELLSGGQAGLALRVLETTGGEPPRAPWSVLVFLGPPAARRKLLAALEDEVFAARSGSSVVVFGAGEVVDAVAEAALRIGGLHGGVAGPVSAEDFAAGLEQAELAARAAEAEDKILVSAAEHTGRGLLSLIDPVVAQAFAHGLLAPLRRHDETGRGDLAGSLRCWLEHHGHWDVAAARLGVHRHTLRNRITKAQELLGRDLDSPGVRAELWVALQT